MRTAEDDLSVARDGWEEAVAENHRLDDLVKEMLEMLKFLHSEECESASFPGRPCGLCKLLAKAEGK